MKISKQRIPVPYAYADLTRQRAASARRLTSHGIAMRKTHPAIKPVELAWRDGAQGRDVLTNAAKRKADRDRRQLQGLNRWDVTVTDTFGGEANFCWRNDYNFELPEGATNRQVVIAAKRAAGWTGMKCDTDNYGDSFTLHPRDLLQVCFIELHDW